MARHILLGTSTENWQLHVTEDALDVDERLRNAFTHNEYATIKVVLGDQLQEELLYVNPRQLGWWTIMERQDPDANPV